MPAEDAEGRAVVDSPVEALNQLAEGFGQFRMVATLSFSTAKKRDALGELAHSLEETKRAVEGSRSVGRGDQATEWRKIQDFVRAMHDELRMWLYLREGDFHAAWDMLMSAQASAECAARWLPDFEPAQSLDEHLASIETVLFPKQMYFSPSFIVEEGQVECNVCGVYGGECDHIAGEIYDGKVASRIIHRFAGVREISLVENPANKYARALTFGNMDLLTGQDPVNAEPLT